MCCARGEHHVDSLFSGEDGYVDQLEQASVGSPRKVAERMHIGWDRCDKIYPWQQTPEPFGLAFDQSFTRALCQHSAVLAVFRLRQVLMCSCCQERLWRAHGTPHVGLEHPHMSHSRHRAPLRTILNHIRQHDTTRQHHTARHRVSAHQCAKQVKDPTTRGSRRGPLFPTISDAFSSCQ